MSFCDAVWSAKMPVEFVGVYWKHLKSAKFLWFNLHSAEPLSQTTPCRSLFLSRFFQTPVFNIAKMCTNRPRANCSQSVGSKNHWKATNIPLERIGNPDCDSGLDWKPRLGLVRIQTDKLLYKVPHEIFFQITQQGKRKMAKKDETKKQSKNYEPLNEVEKILI